MVFVGTLKIARTAFCFDLDGTVSTTEILPCIASEIGVADEIATLTRATMDGHIAFEPSFRLRCLILGQVSPSKVRAIVQTIPLDKSILEFIRANKDQCFLVTGNLDIWIQPISDECGCETFSSVANYENNNLKILKILNKADAIRNLRSRGYERIVTIGDGANDVSMFELADIAIAFGGVHTPSTLTVLAADYVINEGKTLCKKLKML